MKNLLFGLVATIMFSVSSFANNAETSNVKTFNSSEVVISSNQEKLSFSFSSLESLKSFDFNSFLKDSKLEDGQCTVSVSVSYGGASATFSVTADTCAQAGAGAADAATAFVKKVRSLLMD